GPRPRAARGARARAGRRLPRGGGLPDARPLRHRHRDAGAQGVTMTGAVGSTSLPFPLVARGKVRDVYDVGGDRLLMVATDRISAFDVVLSPPIPRKGEVLTQITAWWLARLGDITPHHLIT